MKRPRRFRRGLGFTLTELAVVMFIISLLLGGLMFTLSAQSEQRSRNETLQRLDQAKELVLGFALANGRLPCPASATSLGDESPAGGGACTNYLSGFLPARTIGFQPVDPSGYALDAWGNRIRYALAEIASNPTGGSGCSTPVSPAFSNSANLKSNGIVCAPNRLVVCDAAQNTIAGPPPACGTWTTAGDARSVTNTLTVVAVVHSTGKNGATATTPGPDEAENTDGDGVFVWHEPRPSGATGGEFDDFIVWIPVGLLYGQLIAAGILP